MYLRGCRLGTTLEPALDYERLVRTQPSHRNWSMPIQPMPAQAYPWGYQPTPAWDRSAITQNGQVIPLAGAYSAELSGVGPIVQAFKSGNPSGTTAVGAVAGLLFGGLKGAAVGAFAGFAASYFLGKITDQVMATAAAVTKLQMTASKAGT